MNVHRVSATVLLGVFSFLLIAPFTVNANEEAQMPACCRRTGAHHCTLAQGTLAQGISAQDTLAQGTLAQAGSSGQAIRNSGSKCPYFPVAGSLPAHGNALPLGAAQTAIVSVVSHPAGHEQTQALYRISFSRAQKRGPPVFIS